jgi:hypothetical protein
LIKAATRPNLSAAPVTFRTDVRIELTTLQAIASFSQSGSNFRPFLHTRTRVEAVRRWVSVPSGPTPNELHKAGRSIERNVSGY